MLVDVQTLGVLIVESEIRHLDERTQEVYQQRLNADPEMVNHFAQCNLDAVVKLWGLDKKKASLELPIRCIFTLDEKHFLQQLKQGLLWLGKDPEKEMAERFRAMFFGRRQVVLSDKKLRRQYTWFDV